MNLSISQKIIRVAIALIASLGLVMALPSAAYANHTPAHTACEGIELTGGECDTDGSAQEGIGNVVETIINILSLVVGAVSVIMIIIGGLRYVISGGDSNTTQSARNTIIYALVGLVIVIFAQIIVAFVVGRVDTSNQEAAFDSNQTVLTSVA